MKYKKHKPVNTMTVKVNCPTCGTTWSASKKVILCMNCRNTFETGYEGEEAVNKDIKPIIRVSQD